MENKYLFSQGTIEGNHLIGVTSEVRNAIIDASGIYDEASNINDAVNNVLSKKNNNTEIIDEDKDKKKKEIERILEIDHPRSKALYIFVVSSDENKDWYLKNKENIKLVTDGIEILGDIFCLEDEKVSDMIFWKKGILKEKGNTFFNFNAAKIHAKKNGKKLPENWKKYLDFLPGNDENKIKFLTTVLELKYSVHRDNLINAISNYWGSENDDNKEASILKFVSGNVYEDSCNINDKNSVRCIKS